MGAAWPGILRLVERLLAWPGASAEVEDVAQEVFLAAWRGRGQFRAEAEWTTWLYSIAVRRARNAARARGRRERWFGRLVPGATLDVREASETSEAAPGLSDATRRGMAKLRHGDRELLVLRYLEERTVEELCQWLSLSRVAVDARLSRARARLKDRLSSAQEGDEGGA